MSSFDGINRRIPPDLGVEIWQAVVDLMGLPDVTVSFDQYPPMSLKPEAPAWIEHLELQGAGVGTQGDYIFRQPVYFDSEPREHRFNEYYLSLFLAREESQDHSSGTPVPVRNDQMIMEILREQFLRCRYVPTFPKRRSGARIHLLPQAARLRAGVIGQVAQ